MTSEVEQPVPTGRWRLIPPGVRLRWLDGDVLVYQLGAGDTHWLAGWAGVLLEALEAGPRPAQALAALLDGSGEEAVGGTPDLDDCLTELARIGLIEAVNGA